MSVCFVFLAITAVWFLKIQLRDLAEFHKQAFRSNDFPIPPKGKDRTIIQETNIEVMFGYLMAFLTGFGITGFFLTLFDYPFLTILQYATGGGVLGVNIYLFRGVLRGF